MLLGNFLPSFLKPAAVPCLMLLASLCLGGCAAQNFIDPTDPNRGEVPANAPPLIRPILDTLQEGYDDQQMAFPQARNIEPKDLIPAFSDYTIGKNDLIQVSVSDLGGVGTESVKTARVSESGQISLPLLGPIMAAGLTEAQLEKAIAEKYSSSGIIPRAQVSATVVEARQRVFSTLGAVGHPAQWSIVNSDFRMNDALVVAGDIANPSITTIYVIRKPASANALMPPTESEEPTTQPGPHDPFEPTPTPHSEAPSEHPVMAMQDATTAPAAPIESRPVFVGDKLIPNPTTTGTPVVVTPTDTVALPPATTKASDFEFHASGSETDAEVIRVPFDKLRAGDFTANIVIRPGDLLYAEAPKTGQYYMGAHVARPGVYILGGGNDITLKQAMVSAGGMDATGIPERTDVIRRVGHDKEIWVRVNLAEIMRGHQPDFYLRADDMVMVNTNFGAPFLAAVRGSFRFAYGAGFTYDRAY